MSRNPSPSSLHADLAAGRERIRSRAQSLLAKAPSPFAVADPGQRDAAVATELMDLYRRTGDRDAFDCLVQWASPQLQARIRSRLRGMAAVFDPQEILQDAIVNIYRYPDRFLASRPGAFAAWSSTIVDNAVRRQLRCRRQGVDVALSAPEMLQEQADVAVREPSEEAQDHEECAATAKAFALLLHVYGCAFRALGERERFVLEMVEVRRVRYAELAQILAIRPEALKMVVFRARKRIFDRMQTMLGGAQAMERVRSRDAGRLAALTATA
jgi:RNA polymerase sigma factor (sigma-70 family)